MKKIDYSIEALEETFTRHAKESLENLNRCKKQHKQHFPDDDYQPDEWSLPEALLTIVKEIRALKSV